MDFEKVKSNIPKFDSIKLCEMIVCDRYLNINKQIAILCMEELSKRRESGDDFDFESYIEECGRELPELNFDQTDIRSVIGNLIKNTK